MTIPQQATGKRPFASAQALAEQLDVQAGYLPSTGLAAAAYLAHRLAKPLFLEGAPGVGKTAFARAIATVLTGGRYRRLQCHGGLDTSSALYEWNFPRQVLTLRAFGDGDHSARVPDLWSPAFMISRPILDAVQHGPTVLLIDEIDRADDEFEALLLQVLENYEIDIPEAGTITAAHPPFVVLTSNRTREVHDALKRRCLFHWISHPDMTHEVRILTRAVSDLGADTALQIARTMKLLRDDESLVKTPGVAESIDLAEALVELDVTAVTEETVDAVISTVAKHHDDEPKVRQALLDGGTP